MFVCAHSLLQQCTRQQLKHMASVLSVTERAIANLLWSADLPTSQRSQTAINDTVWQQCCMMATISENRATSSLPTIYHRATQPQLGSLNKLAAEAMVSSRGARFSFG